MKIKPPNQRTELKLFGLRVVVVVVVAFVVAEVVVVVCVVLTVVVYCSVVGGEVGTSLQEAIYCVTLWSKSVQKLANPLVNHIINCEHERVRPKGAPQGGEKLLTDKGVDHPPLVEDNRPRVGAALSRRRDRGWL